MLYFNHKKHISQNGSFLVSCVTCYILDVFVIFVILIIGMLYALLLGLQGFGLWDQFAFAFCWSRRRLLCVGRKCQVVRRRQVWQISDGEIRFVCSWICLTHTSIWISSTFASLSIFMSMWAVIALFLLSRCLPLFLPNFLMFSRLELFDWFVLADENNNSTFDWMLYMRPNQDMTFLLHH